MTCIEEDHGLRGLKANSLRQSPRQQGLEVLGCPGLRKRDEECREIAVSVDPVGRAIHSILHKRRAKESFGFRSSGF